MRKERKGTTELSKTTLGKVPEEGVANRSGLGQHVFRLRNVASLLLVLAILFLVSRQLLDLDWREVWVSVQEANVELFTLAFLIFYCSFPLRALRWETLLANVGYSRVVERTMPSVLGLTRVMYLAWFANCVTLARMGDAYRGYLLKKEAGVSFVVTLGTVLAERLLDILVMAAMMGVGVLVVFGRSLPTEVAPALAAGVLLSVVGIVGLLLMRRFRWVFELVLPKRLHAYYFRLEHSLVDSFRRIPLLVTYSAIGWILEGTTLYATAAAVGSPISVAGALVTALAASLLTTVPITPSGLGLTEAGLVVMLGWLGLDVPAATGVTILFRIINYWSIVVFGFVLYLFSRNAKPLAKERIEIHG
jgi:glycosyltransferase 2 family protein